MNPASGQGAGTLRVVAGAYGGQHGPAHTHSPLDVCDVQLRHGHSVRFAFDKGRTVVLVVLHGTVQINDADIVREAQCALMDREAGEVVLEANSDVTLLVLSGEPLNESIAGYGPFVMNDKAQIVEAFDDLSVGRFGRIAPKETAAVA